MSGCKKNKISRGKNILKSALLRTSKIVATLILILKTKIQTNFSYNTENYYYNFNLAK